MAKKLIPFIPVFVFALILIGAVMMLRRGPEIHTLRSPMIHKPMPDFKAVNLSARDLKGKPAILVFFASWCTPCIGEQPIVLDMAARAGVPVYGIEYRDTSAQHIAFFNRYKDPFVKIADDRDGQIALAFGVSGVPTTMIVDKNGIIRYRRDMPLTEEALDGTILPLARGLKQ